ncbi:CLUMA_CG001216, isoform A [Clunio marinus]|uniref:CLUMA_CG001216, isoform A n=1 Tax=Clunio marinus TaxID=568069 RepID=A0A1J1HLS5_9DIPT|nr:CLUMA_CG001216, isoform A [Clunio marinus]
MNLKAFLVMFFMLVAVKYSDQVRKIPTSCPIEPGFYFLKDFVIDDSFLTYAIPTSKVLITIVLSSKMDERMIELGDQKVQFEVKTREKWEKERKKAKQG